MTLDDCARNVPKRISKLENFLRKKLPQSDLSCLRYYEVCVLESKGALTVRYIILTEDSILMTENPPKTIFMVIRLSQIQDISLVADRRSLVTGSQGNVPFICRHIRIYYEEEEPDSHKRGGKNSKRPQTLLTDEGHSHSHGHGSTSGSSSSSSSRSSSNGEPPSRLSSVTEMSSLLLLDEFSLQTASDHELPTTPSFLRDAYDPFSYSPSSLSPSLIDSGFSSDDLLSLKHDHDHEHMGSDKTPEKEGELSQLDCDNKSLESVSTSISIDHIDQEHDSDHNGSTTSEKKNFLNVDMPKRASSVLDERRNNAEWTMGESDQDLKERPQSIDISQLSSLRRKFIPSYFTRKFNAKETAVSNGKGANSAERGAADGYSKKTENDEKESTLKTKELNIYLYQQPSSLLNELYLAWNRSTLIHGVHKGSVFGVTESENNEQVYSLRAAEKILSSLVQEKVFTDTRYFCKFSQLLPVLCDFQHQLVKYHHLRRLCWKNTNFIRDLVDMTRRAVFAKTGSKQEEAEEGEEEEEESEVQFLERVTAFSILMEIFRLLFESCSTSFLVQSPDKSYPQLHLSHSATTSNLLQLIFSYPVISRRMPGRNKILRVISDPQTFHKFDWINNNNHESNRIKALTLAHNASTALLYEILRLFYFSQRDNEKMTFTSLLRKYSWESYTKQSVTQIINLLWSTRTAQKLKPNQCALLYRHLYNLQFLFQNLPAVKSFVCQTFCEEFQYFVHWNCINMKIPDQYPIKSKLLLIFDELRHQIVQKV